MKKLLFTITSLLLVITNYSQITNGLVCHYPLDGNLNDISGNNHNTNNLNYYSFVSDKDNNTNSALTFDGTTLGHGSYTGINGLNDSALTLSLWFNHKYLFNNAAIKSNISAQNQSSGNYYFSFESYSLNDSATFTFYMYKTGFSIYDFLTIKTDTNWNLYTCVFKSDDTLRMYLNDQLMAKKPIIFSGKLDFIGDKLNFNHSTVQYNNFGSSYDEVRLYNRVLSLNEIQQIYNNSTYVNQFEKSNLPIYPNPVQSTFTIDTDKPIEQIKIYNYSGAIIKSILNPNKTINIENLDKGIYILEVQIGGVVSKQKLIKN